MPNFSWRCLLIPFFIIGLSNCDFNCLRKGVGCMNGGICETNGTCTCISPYNGFNCETDPNKTSDECFNNCGLAGTCYEMTDARCYCSSEYYGASCQFKRVSVNCSEAGMTVNVNPHNSFLFDGQIFVFEKRGTESCKFQKLPSQIIGADENWFGYALYIPYLDVCGNLTKLSNDTVEEYEVKIVTEYNKMMVTSLDELTTIRCVIQTGGNISISSSVEGISLMENVYKKSEPVEDTFSPVKFDLLPVENKDKKTVRLGEVISLEFKLSSQSDLKSLKLESCIAKSNLKNSTFSLVLISNGCKTDSANQLVSENATVIPTRSDDGKSVSLKITAFKFIDSNQVNFNCIVIVCNNGDTSCDSQCPDTDKPKTLTETTPKPQTPVVPQEGSPTVPPNQPVRRKRDVTTQREELNGYIIVSDDSTLDVGANEVDPNKKDICDLMKSTSSNKDSDINCLENSDVMAVIATLSILLILVIITLTVIGIHHIRNKNSKVDSVQGTQVKYTIPRASIKT